MKIKWLGHAAFLITSKNGVRIITDPYTPENGIKLGAINESADIVTTSHDHFDHNAVAAVTGYPEVVKESGTTTVKDIQFKAIPTYHDEDEGTQRGSNLIFCFTVDDMIVCHLGDLGHTLSDSQIADIGNVDILLIPVGGFYTIDAKTATEICDKLKPKVIIPMHFKNEKVEFPIAGVDDFLAGKQNVNRYGSSEVEITSDRLSGATQIIVLNTAR